AANTSKTAIGDSPDFPSAAIAGGKDFAGDAYTGLNTPAPDPDPMDCIGHGTQVAGIVAGRGGKDDGTTLTGPYDTNVPFSTMKIGPGVAPQAKLYDLKVYGCTGSTHLVPQAIDWALDPDQNGNQSDHLDVLLLSSGSVVVVPDDDPLVTAVDNAA